MCTTDPISRKHRTRWREPERRRLSPADRYHARRGQRRGGRFGSRHWDDAHKPTEPGETTAPSETGGETTGTKPVKTMWPVEGETAAAYAVDKLAYNETTRDWRVHNGVDLTAAAGTEVQAAADGTVYTVYDDDLMGTTVVIRHSGGYVTTYSSLSEETAVAAGDTVSCGDTIGTVGQTALTEKALEPHVHFSVTCNDQGMDPAEFVE